MRRYFGITSGIVLVVAILVVGTFAVANADSQKWSLKNQTHAEVSGTQEMQKGLVAITGSVDVGSTPVHWLSQSSAQPDSGITFTSGGWLINLTLQGGWATDCTVEVGEWDSSSSTFIPFSTTAVTSFKFTNNVYEVEYHAGSETIAKDNFLALRVSNNTPVAGEKVTCTGGVSWIMSPTSDPGFPVPEAMTIILLSAGLLGLGGFVWFKRRKAQNAT
ncbi:MAG: PEP-CTERM sorting domain-containing protein [Chloroflexi bacterium]|nr:PEP-CTERM sorting domain-containing protein [Chloroflexota bacterium]